MVVRQRKRAGFSTFMSSVLENSMLTGIPKIVQAGNWQKRISRSLVFVLCVGGFVYQTLTFMDIYWRYETVVNVQVYNPLEADRPAYTVCSYQGLKVQEICADPNHELHEKYDFECYTLGSDPDPEYPIDWCKCVPRFCDYDGKLKNISLIDEDGWYETLNYKLMLRPWDEVKKYYASARDMILGCQELMLRTGEDQRGCARNLSNTIHVPCHFHWFNYQSCFTRDSIVFRPNATIEKVRTIGEIIMQFWNLNDDFRVYYYGPRLFMSIHNPYSVVNPYVDGFILEPAKEHIMFLKKVIKKLLPHPYQTDCMDYRKLWELRGGQGPTNLKECIQECYKNLSLERHGCLIKNIYYPGFDQMCDHRKVQDKTLFVDAGSCIKENCKAACYEEYYSITEDVTEIYQGNACGGKFIEESVVEIRMNGMETTVYEYSPKYEDIETFSYIGGYIGMWLGISLIALFDFLETVVIMMRYPLRKYRLFRAKRTKIQQMHALHRDVY